MPTISIITAAYNAATTMADCLRSMSSQAHAAEHIIIDGASTDSTLNIVRRISSAARIYSEPDRGIYDAMNKGMANASGEFIWFLNAKDTIHDGAFLGTLDWSQDFYYGGVVLRNGEREVKRLMPRPEIGPHSSLIGQVACHQSMIVRRSLAPAYDLRYRFVADFDWSIRILGFRGLKSQRIESHWVNYELDGLSSRNVAKCWKENIDILTRNYGAWARPWAYGLYARFRLKAGVKKLIRPGGA